MRYSTVIKVGGELLESHRRPEIQAIASDIVSLMGEGHRFVFVHGGGPQTTAWQKELGQVPKIIAGRRVTDLDGLEAIKMVIGGKLNIDLCSVLQGAGLSVIGLNGVSSRAIACVRRPPRVLSGAGDQPIDLGFVGDVTGINEGLFQLLMDHHYTPVLACIGSDEHGQPYNINADVVASGIASALSADRLLLVTNTSGVLSDVHDPATRIRQMSVAEALRAIQEGVVSGGMIPKVEESLAALERGVREVVILGGLGPGDLIRSLRTPGSMGTSIVP